MTTTTAAERWEQRRARLADLHRHVDRCPLCGAWRWQTRCHTPHTPTARQVTNNG